MVVGFGCCVSELPVVVVGGFFWSCMSDRWRESVRARPRRGSWLFGWMLSFGVRGVLDSSTVDVGCVSVGSFPPGAVVDAVAFKFFTGPAFCVFFWPFIIAEPGDTPIFFSGVLDLSLLMFAFAVMVAFFVAGVALAVV